MSFLTHLRRNFDAELRRSLRWQYFLNIGLGILGAGFLFALSRLLGPTTFGIYTLCAAIPAVAVAIFDLRLQEVVLYLRESRPREAFPGILAGLFWIDAGSKALVVVASLGAYAIMARLGYPGIVDQYVALAALMTFATKSFSAPAMGTLRSLNMLEYFSIAQVFDWSLRLAGVILLYRLGHLTIPNVFVMQIVAGLPLNWIVVRKARREIGVSLPEMLAGIRNALPVVRDNSRLLLSSQGISATDAVVKELDVLVAGVYLSPAIIGTYKVAKSMAAVAWRLADPILIVIMPKLARLNAEGRTQEMAAFVKAMMAALLGSGLALYSVSIAGAYLLGPIVLGPGYADAIRAFPIAAAWILVALPLVWTHSLAMASGRPGLFLMGSAIGNGLGLAAIWFGTRAFGLEGALTGLSLAFCLPFLFSFVFLRRFRVVEW